RSFVVGKREVEHGEVEDLLQLVSVSGIFQNVLEFSRGHAGGVQLVVLVQSEDGTTVFDDGNVDLVDVTTVVQVSIVAVIANEHTTHTTGHFFHEVRAVGGDVAGGSPFVT